VQKIRVGLIRNNRKPSGFTKTIHALALMNNIEFFYFTENRVNIESQNIRGLFWDVKKCEYVEKFTPYPHIVDNMHFAFKQKEVRNSLKKSCILTYVSLRNKDKLPELLGKSELSKYVIDTKTYSETNVTEMLNQYGEIVIKPVNSHFGLGVHKVIQNQKNADEYCVHYEKTIEKFTRNEFFEKYTTKFTDKNYAIQQYIDSTTKLNQPFDVRVNLRRGNDGNWEFVGAFARIGDNETVVSNVAQGGSIATDLKVFLESEFSQEHEKIYNEITVIAEKLPLLIQESYERPLIAMGIDIGINKDLGDELKIFEINGDPMESTLKVPVALARVECYKWLYENFDKFMKSQNPLRETPKLEEIPHIEREPAPPLSPILTPRFVQKSNFYSNSNSVKSGNSNELSLMFIGDLMARYFQHQKALCEDGSYDFNPSFKYVRNYFEKADLVVGNLETCISHSFPYRGELKSWGGTPNCNAPTTYLDAIRYAGVDAVVTANNHCCDAGQRGIIETLEHLNKYHLPNTGIFSSPEQQRYMILETNGVKLGVLSYTACGYNRKSVLIDEDKKNFMLNTYSYDTLKRDVVAARDVGAKFITVFVHWGREHTHEVTDKQRKLASEIANAGVDLIVGSHPHVLQEFDFIPRKKGGQTLVVYSLGNFLADMTKVKANTQTAIFTVKLTKTPNGGATLKTFSYVPCVIEKEAEGDPYVVVPLTDEYKNCLSPENAKNMQKILSSIDGVLCGKLHSYAQ